ncbi:TPM domain-containing protein [Paenibacillus sp. 7541]|uniref:TPM domain-containing protein n=1 Tax=Paenibacillus sp. 7541 TaxID=2026236 RepID=UPI0020D164D3|nr:TPM domain-containing protein [Paenibacillus sp. 7541]
MRRARILLASLLFIVMIVTGALSWATEARADEKQLIFDDAGLLTTEEYEELNQLANERSAERETDIMILTVDGPDAYDVMRMTQDFYDEYAPGYDQPHGNTAILMVDMYHREFYVAGFKKAEEYVNNQRADEIRDHITPDMANGDYKLAFQKYIEDVYEYMGITPEPDMGTDSNSGMGSGTSSGTSSGTGSGGGNSSSSGRGGGSGSAYSPSREADDSIFNNIWVQIGISVVIGGVVVGLMLYNAGGRVTVNGRTYENSSVSGVRARRDQYLHTTTTKRKIERNNNSGGGGFGGGGGGRTSGGHSHSGSRGSF